MNEIQLITLAVSGYIVFLILFIVLYVRLYKYKKLYNNTLKDYLKIDEDMTEIIKEKTDLTKSFRQLEVNYNVLGDQWAERTEHDHINTVWIPYYDSFKEMTCHGVINNLVIVSDIDKLNYKVYTLEEVRLDDPLLDVMDQSKEE